MSEANVKVKVHSNEEAWDVEADLKNYGYTKTSDCYWYQRWEKDGWVVDIERV